MKKRPRGTPETCMVVVGGAPCVRATSGHAAASPSEPLNCSKSSQPADGPVAPARRRAAALHADRSGILGGAPPRPAALDLGLEREAEKGADQYDPGQQPDALARQRPGDVGHDFAAP